jgi:site-specific DNA-cytosine methylase
VIEPSEPFVKSSRAQTSDDSETWIPGEVNPTLNSFDVGDTRATTAIVEPVLIDGQRVGDVRIYTEPVQTLGARMGTGGNNVPMLAYDEYNDSISETHHALRAGTKQSTGVLIGSEVAATLRSGGDGGVPSSRGEHLVAEPTMAVRRLTPLECERLMGWPDDHTRYKADGTEQADTHRYKQCGNGVASPVAQWIAKHILNI